MMKTVFWKLLLLFIPAVQACGQAHQKNLNRVEKMQEAEKHTVVLNNHIPLIPLKNLNTKQIVSIDFGFSFQKNLDSLNLKYAPVALLKTNNYADDLSGLIDDTKFYNLLIATLPDSALLDTENIAFLKKIQSEKSLVICLFGDGKYLPYLDEIEAPIIWCNQKTAEAAELSAQILFGGRGVHNRLPDNFSDKYIKGSGFDTFPFRLAYSVPEEIGLNSDDFKEIDKIAQDAIKAQATPGAEVLVVLNGKVIFNKAYGHHTYSKERPSSVGDIYDLASITKITATTVAAMKLYEEKKLDLNAPISQYISRTQKTDKANIKIKDILLHQAGFIPFIPFHQELKPGQFSRDSTQEFSCKVADSFYVSKSFYRNVMWKKMLETPLRTPGKYVYSDLSMYYLKEVIESITSESLPNYLNANFYRSLGLNTMMFNPRNKFDKAVIVPTEEDGYFRHTLLWGYVHDQGAALAGGVAGHAGLFSNSTDLATISQMLLNKGKYGGTEYFKPQTVDLFTSRQSNVSRRGLGFDRWEPDTLKKYPSEYASNQTYGHTGYTGTCVWIDPAHNLIYIFLSNRVHPKVTNKLISMNVRSGIHNVIYKAIRKEIKQ